MSRRIARIAKPALVWVRKPLLIVRDREFLDWVATLPCLSCGRRGCSVPAHIRLGTDAAAGRKPGDRHAVPLCGVPHVLNGCHELQHAKGEQSFWANLMAQGVSDPWGVSAHLWSIRGDDVKGWRAIAHARPGMPTAVLEAA